MPTNVKDPCLPRKKFPFEHSNTKTLCKVGRIGTTVSVLGKNGLLTDLSPELMRRLNTLAKNTRTPSKIPVYGLSRAEIGALIHGVTKGTCKRVRVFPNTPNSDSVDSYIIYLQEGEKNG